MSAADYYWVQWSNGKRYYTKANSAVIAKSKIPPQILPHIQERNKSSQAETLAASIRKTAAKIAFLNQYRDTNPSVPGKIHILEQDHELMVKKFTEFPEAARANISLNFNPSEYNFKPPREKAAGPKPAKPPCVEEILKQYFNAKPPPTSSEDMFKQNFGTYPRPPPGDWYRSFFGKGATPKAPNAVPPRTAPNPPRPVPRETDTALLAKVGITSKKEWKQWMLAHHPDKDPNCDMNVVQEVCAAANRLYRT